jgi:hypothetical protein
MSQRHSERHSPSGQTHQVQLKAHTDGFHVVLFSSKKRKKKKHTNKTVSLAAGHLDSGLLGHWQLARTQAAGRGLLAVYCEAYWRSQESSFVPGGVLVAVLMREHFLFISSRIDTCSVSPINARIRTLCIGFLWGKLSIFT